MSGSGKYIIVLIYAGTASTSDSLLCLSNSYGIGEWTYYYNSRLATGSFAISSSGRYVSMTYGTTSVDLDTSGTLVSNDYGKTFSNVNSVNNFVNYMNVNGAALNLDNYFPPTSISMSASGQFQIITTSYYDIPALNTEYGINPSLSGKIFASSDYGKSWYCIHEGLIYWSNAKVSASGQYVTINSRSGGIFVTGNTTPSSNSTTYSLMVAASAFVYTINMTINSDNDIFLNNFGLLLTTNNP